MVFRLPNPFKPSAGATPPRLVGRQAVLAEFEESLEDGPGAPLRLTRITGARGVGKTVLLTSLGQAAAARGWVVIAETATAGLVARLVRAMAAWQHQITAEPRRRIRSVELPSVLGIGGGGVTFDEGATEQHPDLRAAAGALLDVLQAHGTGLLITLDEIHDAARDEIRLLATVFQHLVREDRDVALAMAGLPSAVSDLLNDDVLTFLRRAVPIDLADVPLPEVSEGLRRTIVENGRAITGEALEIATRATEGYPFLIQLVGYHLWRSTQSEEIDLAAAHVGVEAARQRLGSTVLATALADLSTMDRSYLAAMAVDDGPSNTGDIARRLGRSRQYAGNYRARLIDAGLIEVTGHGLVDFAVPHLRQFVRSLEARFHGQ